MRKIILAIICLFFANQANATISEWKDALTNEEAAQARILSSIYIDQNNNHKLILGLQIKIASGWKIYGNDSNGIGMPPSLNFKDSINYKSHEIFWPKAISQTEKFGDETLRYSIYHNEVILPVSIALVDENKPTTLKITINYGLCKDICVPASADFIVNVTNETDNKALELIQKFSDQKLLTISASDANKTAQPLNIKTALLSALFAAFIGGLILNIMPCVLPVLGIKLMSVIKHKDAKLANIRLAFLSTTIGIISCFALFAILALLIRLTGNIFDWGLQFQNPYFIIFLITILLGFIANMLGLFEITFDQFLSNIVNKKISEKEKSHHIFMPNFLSGILAVLLATPCSAPFLGSAISFSIAQSSAIILLIFIVMGLGFSLPYIILLASPRLISYLPKPGNWMLNIKKIMAILLIATVIWLIYVLSNNIGSNAGITCAIIAMIFFATFKLKFKFAKTFIFGILITLIFSLPNAFSYKKTFPTSDMIWEKFDEAKLHQLVSEGNVVVVDVTADWCITCKFNKTRVLRSDAVMQRLLQDKTIAMRADITKPNEDAMKFIHKKGRYAIPFNAIYGPNAKDGLLTKELLDKDEFLKLIDEAS